MYYNGLHITTTTQRQRQCGANLMADFGIINKTPDTLNDGDSFVRITIHIGRTTKRGKYYTLYKEVHAVVIGGETTHSIQLVRPECKLGLGEARIEANRYVNRHYQGYPVDINTWKKPITEQPLRTY